MKSSLEREYEYFIKNQNLLAKKHPNKFLVIKNCKVIGVYNSKEEAYEESSSENKLGTFLIQQAVSKRKTETKSFYTRVVFK